MTWFPKNSAKGASPQTQAECDCETPHRCSYEGCMYEKDDDMTFYRAEPCPCGYDHCDKWFVTPGADVQGCGWDEGTAKMVAEFLNAREEAPSNAVGVVPSGTISSNGTKVLNMDGDEIPGITRIRMDFKPGHMVVAKIEVPLSLEGVTLAAAKYNFSGKAYVVVHYDGYDVNDLEVIGVETDKDRADYQALWRNKQKTEELEDGIEYGNYGVIETEFL